MTVLHRHHLLRVSEAEPALGLKLRGEALQNLRAVVVLGGAVHPTELMHAVGRSMLELPLSPGVSLVDHWVAACVELAGALGRAELAVRVMLDAAAPMPRHARAPEPITLSLERDPSAYRGTAGLLSDLAQAYDDDDMLLVVNAHQVLLQRMSSLAADLAARQADATIVSHDDGTPSGFMLLRCGVLRGVPAVGFVDMKEQALPQIARRHRVSVLRLPGPSAFPVRSLPDYVQALRLFHNTGPRRVLDAASSTDSGPFAEAWRSSFEVIEDGAHVDATARVHDAVVLRGGAVERGAVLVRSVVCAGATVARGQMAVDKVVKAGRE